MTIAATPGDGATINGYMIKVNDNAPPDPAGGGWEAELTQFTIPAETAEGIVNLYAWVRDSNNDVVLSVRDVTCCTGTEIDKSVMTADASTNDGDPAPRVIDGLPADNVNSWRCQNDDPTPWLRIDLGETYEIDRFVYMGDPNSGNHRMKDYRLYVTESDSTDEADWGTEVASGVFENVPSPPVNYGEWGVPQVVILDPPAEGRYVILRAVSSWAYWPGCSEVWAYGTAQIWPIPGDSNLDCKVNILDLIFVRNRLNQDVETGDNWQADVNEDDKINILDLIYVRNRLNTKCEQ